MSRGLRKELALLSGLISGGLLLAGHKNKATALGILSAGLYLLPAPKYSLADRTAIITGGSRGLGLALAEALLNEGASVALIARDPVELQRAEAFLQEFPANRILTISCDITQPELLERAVQQVENTFGKIDILVNNAGTISVGPFESMEQRDFEALLHLQIHAVVNAVQFVLPAFFHSGEGRIVNICSIGGKVPVPHMAPYCASKFALSGLSESIGSELAQHNIKVTTVYPGLMRTGSPIQAVFKGSHEKEYAWFSTGDVTPVISVSAEYAARKILAGLKNGDSQVMFPLVSRLGSYTFTLFPELYAFVMRQANRFFPKGQSLERKTGAQSRNWLDRQIWYWPFQGTTRRAEKRFNQVEKFDPDFNLGV